MAVIQTMVAGVQTEREVATKWEGQFLIVHRPMIYRDEIQESRADKFWQITHKKSGMAAGGRGIDAKLRDVIALAKLWDKSFRNVTPKRAPNWRLREQWKAAIRDLENQGTIKAPVNITWKKSNGMPTA